MFYRQHRNNLHKAQMFTADQLNKEYDFIDWKVFFKHIFNARGFPGTQDQFIVNSPQYLKSVTGLVKTITEEEDFPLVKDFLHWRIVDSLVPILTLPFRQARSDFSSQMSGVKKKYVIHVSHTFKLNYLFYRKLNKVSSKSCFKATEKKFKYAVGYIYVTEMRSSVRTSDIMKMIDNIKKALERLINRSGWMDAETKKRAIEKSDMIGSMVGFSETMTDLVCIDKIYVTHHSLSKDFIFQEKLNKLYNKQVEHESFYQSVLEDIRMKNRPKKLISRLRKPVSKESWSTTPGTINAYYTAIMNKIIIPLGILQDPFYEANRPDVLNYGGIGFSIGHELSHAFDDNGRKYNGDGDLESWWSSETLEEFNQHTDCLVSQYQNMTLAGQHVNGRSTL